MSLSSCQKQVSSFSSIKVDLPTINLSKRQRLAPTHLQLRDEWLKWRAKICYKVLAKKNKKKKKLNKKRGEIGRRGRKSLLLKERKEFAFSY